MEVKENGKSMIMPMNFPEELVTEILSRLPVKSLLQFKCVCKSWCNRISTKDFTFLHLTNYKTPDLVLAGLADGHKPWKLSIANVSPPTRAFAEAAENLPSRIVDYPLPKEFDFYKIWALDVPEVCGPCNGIFCLYRQEKRVLCCGIHSSTTSKLFLNLTYLVRLYSYTAGFGFDSETNDYKILQIVRNLSIHQQQQLELYSLGTNSWRKLDASPLNTFCGNPLFTAYGKIGWLGMERKVYLFDVSNETFDIIPISLEGEADRRATNLEVFPFRESIAVVISVMDVPSQWGYCEIWVLNDFSCAQSRSWSKLCTIKHENIYEPQGFCGNSYLIFRGCLSNNFMLYDLLNHDVVDVGASMVKALVYKESLISIRGHKRKEIVPQLVCRPSLRDW